MNIKEKRNLFLILGLSIPLFLIVLPIIEIIRYSFYLGYNPEKAKVMKENLQIMTDSNTWDSFSFITFMVLVFGCIIACVHLFLMKFLPEIYIFVGSLILLYYLPYYIGFLIKKTWKK
jgi:ABC-type sugar transport system permease subunit